MCIRDRRDDGIKSERQEEGHADIHENRGELPDERSGEQRNQHAEGSE